MRVRNASLRTSYVDAGLNAPGTPGMSVKGSVAGSPNRPFPPPAVGARPGAGRVCGRGVGLGAIGRVSCGKYALANEGADPGPSQPASSAAYRSEGATAPPLVRLMVDDDDDDDDDDNDDDDADDDDDAVATTVTVGCPRKAAAPPLPSSSRYGSASSRPVPPYSTCPARTARAGDGMIG